MVPRKRKSVTTPRHDTPLFLAIVGVLAVPLVYVLQDNGVVHIGPTASTLIYVGIFSCFLWAFLRWEVPCRWHWAERYGLLAVICCFLIGIATIGIMQDIRQVHQKSPEAANVTIAAGSSQGSSGDAFPALVGANRPFQLQGYGTSFGNLKERLVAVADKIDKYQIDHPNPYTSPNAEAKWIHDRSEDFRLNILEPLVNIHDEMKWLHFRDEELDMLLETESYKEQINVNGGVSERELKRNFKGDFSFHPEDLNGPKRMLDITPADLDAIAKRLRALAVQTERK